MARHDSQLELSIDLGNDESDTALLQLIPSPPLEAVVDQTLPEAPNGESTEIGVTKQVFVTPTELPTNLGDIVISWPTIVRQATEVGHNSTYELLYLLAHGVLHLVGYDDQTE